jgi:hypothetical protein
MDERLRMRGAKGSYACTHMHAGLRDGAFGEAAFHDPQGVCYDSSADCLYVADSSSHAVRCACMHSISLPLACTALILLYVYAELFAELNLIFYLKMLIITIKIVAVMIKRDICFSSFCSIASADLPAENLHHMNQCWWY